MKKLFTLFIFLFAIQVSAQPPRGAAANSKKRPPASAATRSVTGKIIQFLGKETSYTKVSENIWLIPYKGKSLAQFEVFVTTATDNQLVVMGVVIAKNKQMRLGQDLLYTILKYNHEADQVKAGIDGEGDLFMRAEINGRLMDEKEFKHVLGQIAAASDQLHGQISSFLVPPAP